MGRAIGIDVGGTAIKAVLVDMDGTIVQHHTVPTPRDPEVIVSTVAQIAAELDPDAPVGVCVPGVVDEERGLGVLSVNLGWRDLPLGQMLGEAIGREVGFGHDVRCGARAQARWGRPAGRLLYLAVGTGLAAVTVLDGLPLAGLWAGEIGQPLVTDPATGEVVSVERVAGAAAIVERYAASGVRRDAGGAREVFAAAADGDAVAQRVIADALDMLAQVSALAISLVAPDRVVVAGGLSMADEQFIVPLGARIRARLGVLPCPPIEASEFGSFAQAMGAASLVMAGAR